MQYVDREEKREAFRQDTLKAWEDYRTTGLHATATWRAVSCGDMVTACRSRCSPRWDKENGVSCCDRRLVS